MRRLLPCCVVLVLGCGPGDAHDGPGDTDADPDTDGVAADDASDPPDDASDPPAESDVPDSDPDPWTDGLVDVSGVLLGPDALVADPGHPDDPRAGAPQTMSISFGDLDGDGRPEVVVGANTFGTAGGVGHRVYHWRDGALAPADDVVLPPLRNAVVGLLDLDGDGHLDLVSHDLAGALAFGRGDGTFEAPLALEADFSDRFGTQVTPWDVDADGWLDLLVTGDCDVGLRYALRTGPRAWRMVDDRTEETGPAVMGSSLVTIPDPDGTLVYMGGNACDVTRPHPGFYRVIDDRSGDPRLRAVEVPLAAPAWATMPGLASARYPTELMPMGGTLTDLDGDGRQDLLVTLGTPFVGAWVRAADGGYVDRSIDLRLDVPLLQPQPASPWGVADPDLDRDGDGDLVVSIGDDATMYALAAGSPVRAALFRADPGGFHDVAATAGLTAIGSWHSVVLTDLDADGDADLGLGGYGASPRLYRNDLPGGGGVALRLRGTTSNHLGYGATVEVEAPGLPARSQVLVRQGQLDAAPEPIVFAGLGAATTATVRVRWPSGLVQVVEDVGPGPHTIVEPELVAVTPASRRLPADGTSTASVRITPRRADGSFDPAVAVAVTVDGATVLGAPVRDGDGWRVDVRAPRTPQRTRVVVRLDGVAVGIRPVLEWVAP